MIRELENIPAFWTAIFHWLSCLLYVYLLPRKRSVPQCALLGMALFAGMFPCMEVTARQSGVPFFIGTTCFFAMTLLFFFLICQGGFSNHLYYASRALVLGGFAVSLAWQLYIYYDQRLPFLKTFPAQAAFMLALGGAVYTGMFLLEWGHRREMQEMAISWRACLAVALIAQIIYRLNGLSYFTTDLPFTTTVEADAFALRTIFYLGGLAILFAYHLQVCDTFALQEVNALQNILEMQYANYRQSQESIDMINQKYHDLKHQIALLRTEIGGQQKLACLDQIEGEIQAYESQSQTGNKVLDVILTQKSAHCLRQGITLITMADGTVLDFMKVTDLSALFGNALDNAIDAVSVLPDPEQRLIRLYVARWKGFMRIRVENRCAEDLMLHGELPPTTKEDKHRHGYGLKSIQATVGKYSGSVTLQAKGGWFTLGILIPLPDELSVT